MSRKLYRNQVYFRSRSLGSRVGSNTFLRSSHHPAVVSSAWVTVWAGWSANRQLLIGQRFRVHLFNQSALHVRRFQIFFHSTKLNYRQHPTVLRLLLMAPGNDLVFQLADPTCCTVPLCQTATTKRWYATACLLRSALQHLIKCIVRLAAHLVGLVPVYTSRRPCSGLMSPSGKDDLRLLLPWTRWDRGAISRCSTRVALSHERHLSDQMLRGPAVRCFNARVTIVGARPSDRSRIRALKQKGSGGSFHLSRGSSCQAKST